MRTFEYRVEKFRIGGMFKTPTVNVPEVDNLLNKLGSEGWELVSMESTSTSYGISYELILVFKRESRF